MNILIMQHSHEVEADFRILNMEKWQPAEKEEIEIYNQIQKALKEDDWYWEDGYETWNILDKYVSHAHLELPCQVDKVIDLYVRI